MVVGRQVATLPFHTEVGVKIVPSIYSILTSSSAFMVHTGHLKHHCHKELVSHFIICTTHGFTENQRHKDMCKLVKILYDDFTR